MFTHYVQGWLGCLHNYGNTLVSIVAPYMDNAFYRNCLFVNACFRQNGRGMTEAISALYPPFGMTPFITGELCRPLEGTNRVRYLVHKMSAQARSSIGGNQVKSDYNHAFWLGTLFRDPDFNTYICSPDEQLNYLIPDETFRLLVERGLGGQLTRTQYRFLWKLLALKVTLSWNLM